MEVRVTKRTLKFLQIEKIAVWTLLLLFASVAVAQQEIEFTPSISVGETYDDNILLDSMDTESDYMTTVSPRFELRVVTKNNELGLDYAPSFVFYRDNEQYDGTRHTGSLTFLQDLSERWTFDLSDTYLQSEEPIEQTEGITGVRRTREPYQRNDFRTGLGFTFGPENVLSVGYRDSRLENDDEALDDSVSHNPNAALTYWLSVKNGLALSYEYDRLDYSRDDILPLADDYEGHRAGLSWLHRFNPNSTGNITYRHTVRDFDGLTEDYQIHDGSVGIEYAFSPEASLSADIGYYIRNNDSSEDEDGLTYRASVVRRFERGNLTLSGSGGWDEAYQDAETRGFTRFWSVDTQIDYQMLEPLSGYIGGTYRKDKDAFDREWEVIGGNVGLQWNIHRWFSLALDYTYGERDEEVSTYDYKVNRVMITLAGSRLFRW